MKNLISNTAFGHYLRKLNYGNYIALRMNYDDFLSQVLELWMFVPCELIDGIWTVLSDTYASMPNRNDYFNDEGGNPELYQFNIENWRKYRKAKERVLFEEFSIEPEFKNLVMHNSEWGLTINNMNSFTVEFYANNNYAILLTKTAQKQIGL